jgi:transposase
MRKARHHGRHARASDQRLELITGGKRRRARSAREKAAIVAEAFAPGANVAKIRRHHGLLFSWRRQVRRARPSPVAEATPEEGRDPAFVPVEIEGPVGSPAGPIIADPPSPIPSATTPIIEIVMPAGTVRVPTGADAATLATVLATLRALA